MAELLLQACCLPVRRSPASLEVLLVTSRYTGEWIAPKGTIEAGETAEGAALREAEEEAGVRGRLVGRLGVHLVQRGHRAVRLEAFVMVVTEELPRWLEALSRRRCWFTLAEAQQVVRRPVVLTLLGRLAEGLDALGLGEP